MVAIAVLLLVYILIYCGFILAFFIGFGRVRTAPPINAEPRTTFSIVIPFRTEGSQLPVLLGSLAALDYPKPLFELIFVDDASEDFSVNLINKWRMANGLFQTTMLENIRISGSPKKDAIMRAMPIVKTDWVITVDADCEVPPGWLRAYNDFIAQNRAEMIAGPVTYGGKNSLLHHFQRMDFLSLQAVTIGSFGLKKPFLCNGANFAYTKKLFHEIGGFQGNEAIASGDDVFLLHKAVERFPEDVRYLKSSQAIVRTQPVSSWAALFNQRVRWAAKAVAYAQPFADNVAFIVFVANLIMASSLVAAASGFMEWRFALALFALKLLADWLLLARGFRFLGNGKVLFPVFSAVIYPFFCVAVALYSLFGKYRWKGRVFRT